MEFRTIVPCGKFSPRRFSLEVIGLGGGAARSAVSARLQFQPEFLVLFAARRWCLFIGARTRRRSSSSIIRVKSACLKPCAITCSRVRSPPGRAANIVCAVA